MLLGGDDRGGDRVRVDVEAGPGAKGQVRSSQVR
jgi:hypothetical protein